MRTHSYVTRKFVRIFFCGNQPNELDGGKKMIQHFCWSTGLRICLFGFFYSFNYFPGAPFWNNLYYFLISISYLFSSFNFLCIFLFIFLFQSIFLCIFLFQFLMYFLIHFLISVSYVLPYLFFYFNQFSYLFSYSNSLCIFLF